MVAQSNMVKKRKTSMYRMRGKFFDFACALPAIIFFIVFTYYPVIDLFRISLTNWNLMKPNYDYVGLKNYNGLFSGGAGTKRLLSSLQVTFTYTILDVAFSCILGLLLALLFNRMTRSFKVMRTLVILPKYVTVSASALIFLWIYNESYGVLNVFYKTVGLEPIAWLNRADTALWAVIIFSVWRSVGYSMMIYLSAIKGLNQDYFEAASLDGANGYQQFVHITVPLIAPTTLFLAVTGFLAAMKVYQTIEIMTGGGPYEATNAMVYWIYDLAFKSYRLDRASTVGIVFFVILLVCTLVTMRWSDRKVNYDA